MAPLISLMVANGMIEPRAYHQTSVFDAAVQFARTEGIVPAPEPSHAIRAAIDEALICKETGEEKTILFHLCGHGHFDMSAYENYFAGNMVDYAYPEDEIREAMASVPVL
jgi:tryptophan synthase beta chain